MRISQENGNCLRPQGNQSPSQPRTQTSSSLNSFPKSARLLRRSIFREFGRETTSFRGKAVFIKYRPAQAPRLGITVTKKFGNAVVRNRFKRLIRENFRTLFSSLPNFEFVVFPKSATMSFPDFSTIREDFKSFLDHLLQGE